jgi:hypothetical protein
MLASNNGVPYHMPLGGRTGVRRQHGVSNMCVVANFGNRNCDRRDLSRLSSGCPNICRWMVVWVLDASMASLPRVCGCKFWAVGSSWWCRDAMLASDNGVPYHTPWGGRIGVRRDKSRLYDGVWVQILAGRMFAVV